MIIIALIAAAIALVWMRLTLNKMDLLKTQNEYLMREQEQSRKIIREASKNDYRDPKTGRFVKKP